jgi:hypothetical protein
MKRWDAAIIAAGLPTAVIGWQVAETAEGRFIALMTTIGAILAGVAVNHSIARAPRLVVSYGNPQAANEPVVWNDPTQGRAHLIVQVENVGPASARAVEVEFDHLGVQIFNASGNDVDSEELNIRHNPPRFTGGERVLNPGDSPWKIAGLFSIHQDWRAGMARWRARAEGMDEQAGEVEITLIHAPTP